jgi:16S rRNA processing protein RimM
LSGETERWVAVARILRARGNKGEVAAELLTDFPERLKTIREVFLSDGSGTKEPRRVELRSFWIDQNHRGQAVFHFANSGSISDAEKLRGLDVLLPFAQRVTLPAGQYFVSELIGCAVFQLTEGASSYASPACAMETAPTLLGTVNDVQFTGEDESGTPLLAVDTPQGELLVPLAEDICRRIDVVAKRIEVVLPDGLRELNEKK